jgi:hypothetical protein
MLQPGKLKNKRKTRNMYIQGIDKSDMLIIWLHKNGRTSLEVAQKIIKQMHEPTDYGVCQVSDSIILKGTAVYGQSGTDL